MKRSEINAAYLKAQKFMEAHGWALPPNPCWDITDLGLGDFGKVGLVLVNLAEEPEYCEKIMYAEDGQVTPAHFHAKKKEDIICRVGLLRITTWAPDGEDAYAVHRNGALLNCVGPQKFDLAAGERLTLLPGVWHEFTPQGGPCLIGEVSTANDDANDNFFRDPKVGRFPEILEDASPLVRLISEGGPNAIA